MIWYPNKQKQSPESVLLKKVFLKISQNSQENPYAKVSFLIKFQAEAIKKRDSTTDVFLWILRNF